MQPVRALIVDDERLSRTRLQRFLSLDPEIEVMGECQNGDEAADFLAGNAPDLVFLDVQMPGRDGFGVLSELPPDRMPVVVFVTAFEEYAVRAFEAHAFDYLRKPFDRKRFADVLRRAKSQVALLRQGHANTRLLQLIEEMESRKQDHTRIAIRSGGHVVLVRTNTIDWVEAADNYVCLHCGGETHIVRETMNSFETKLDANRFLRIHRSTIVNLDRVKEMQPWFRGDYQVILQDGTRLTLSRSYRDKLRGVLLKAF